MYYTKEDFLETAEPETLSIIARARELTRAYYLTDYNDKQKRKQTLSELFGSIGENVTMIPHFIVTTGKIFILEIM